MTEHARIVAHDEHPTEWRRSDRTRLLDDLRDLTPLETSQYVDYGLKIVTTDGILLDFRKEPTSNVASYSIVGRTGFDVDSWEVPNGKFRYLSHGPLDRDDLLAGARRLLARLRAPYGPGTIR